MDEDEIIATAKPLMLDWLVMLVQALTATEKISEKRAFELIREALDFMETFQKPTPPIVEWPEPTLDDHITLSHDERN